MPVAYANPSDKCWFNALMICLTVFRPFQNMLNSTEKPGPVTTFLKAHFHQQPLCRINRGGKKEVDTIKVMRTLQQAIQEHMQCYPRSGQIAYRMLHYDSGYQDPGEFWNALHDIVRVELQTTPETSHIGVHVQDTLYCSECHNERNQPQLEAQYMYHALELNALKTDAYPSVQAAVQSFFSPESLPEVRCPTQERVTLHRKLLQCQGGGSGLVLYGPFSDQVPGQGVKDVRHFANTEFQLEDDLRLPFKGPSSGLQSAYELTAFVFRLVDRAHYITCLKDVKGKTWIFDDGTITTQLPEDGWVPVLVFYERGQEQIDTDAMITFPVLVPRGSRLSETPITAQLDGDDAQSTGSISPQGVTTRHGRHSQITNRFKPPDGRQLKPIQAKKAAISSPAHAATDKTPCNKPVSTALNPLAAKYPVGSWIWAKSRVPLACSPGAYLVARIVGPASQAYMNVQWAREQARAKISNKSILRSLLLSEERLIFPLPQDSGRVLTLTEVTALLNSEGTTRQLSVIPNQQDQAGEGYSGLVITLATTNWNSLALPWIVSDDTCFRPTELLGMPFSMPTKVPSDFFAANHEFKKHPSFGNCIREVALILKQLKTDDRLYEQLFAWLHLLPFLLLRAPNSCGHKALAALIEKRCTLLLEGKWSTLYAEAITDAQKLCTRRSGPKKAQPTNTSRQVQRATECIRAGNLSKGGRILTGAGTSTDPEAYTELVAKHPQDVPPAFFAPGYAPPAICTQDERDLDFLTSPENLARVACSVSAHSHPDQFGWRLREFIGPLLHDPALGPLMIEVLIQPRVKGILPQGHGDCYRGGCLIALSKAPKPGVRPINVGDAFRRLSDKALQPFSKKDLAHMFEHAYPNVKQFACSPDGAEKFIVTTLLALQEPPVPDELSLELPEDPMVIITLDAKNAFNSIHRQFVFDMIQGDFTESYAKGRLTRETVKVLPHTFAAHIPSIMGHYEGDGRLTFVGANGEAHHITSRTGVHQGCVLGSKLFCIGTLSLVGATMADHPDVFCPMLSDNITVVGPLSKAFAAASDLHDSLAEAGLSLQPDASGMYIPSYVQHDSPPELLESMRTQYPALKAVPWQQAGLVLLGCPVGSDDFVHSTLTGVCDAIHHRVVQYADVDDGLIHLQLLKFSVNSMLPYFLRTISPDLTVPHARRTDALVLKALLDFSEVPHADRVASSLRSVFEDAQCQVSLPISDGGLGITPNECVGSVAFYSGVSRALRFASSIQFSPITAYLASPAFRRHPLCVAYVKARQDLLDCGAVEPDQVVSQASPVPSHPAGSQPSMRKCTPPVLPTLLSVLVHDSLRTEQLVFPEQKKLTRLAQQAVPRWSVQGLSQAGLQRTRHLSRQSIPARSLADVTGIFLHGVANFGEKLVLRHSPLSFITHTESLCEKFPRDVFAVLLSFLLGLRAPLCLQNSATAVCEGCSQPMDLYGHHRMRCAKTSSFHVAHSQLAAAFTDVARKSSVPYTDKNVPRHLTTDKVGDALINLSDDSRQLILDFTVVHPVLASPSAPGSVHWDNKVLPAKVKDKLKKHSSQYAVMGYAFAPCASTTYGHFDGHLLRLLYILASKRAEWMHVNYRPFTPVEQLFGVYFAQGRARIGAAVARGMALRALGCSAFGASKVFLRHIAPARYRDQTLSSGEHLAAGFSQWRLALPV